MSSLVSGSNQVSAVPNTESTPLQKREREESPDGSSLDSTSKRSKNNAPPSSSSSSKQSQIPASFLLREIHPDHSLTPDATLLMNQIMDTFLVAIKHSDVAEGKKEIFTLPIVQHCLENVLKEREGYILIHHLRVCCSKVLNREINGKVKVLRVLVVVVVVVVERKVVVDLVDHSQELRQPQLDFHLLVVVVVVVPPPLRPPVASRLVVPCQRHRRTVMVVPAATTAAAEQQQQQHLFQIWWW